jgi:hypothetical protein
LLKVLKAYFQDFMDANRDGILGSIKRWASSLLQFIEWSPPQNMRTTPKDIMNVRKWSGAILANAVASAQQNRKLNPSASALIDGCHRLLRRTEPPLEPQMKSLLSAVLEDTDVDAGSSNSTRQASARLHLSPTTIATLWKRKGLTSGDAITLSDMPSSDIPQTRERKPFVGAKVNAAEGALEALMAAEEEDAALQSSSTASSDRLGRIKHRPPVVHMREPSSSFASSSSSSSLAFSAQGHQMHTHGEGDLVKLTTDSLLLMKSGHCYCTACGALAEDAEWLIVRTKNLFQPYVRHLHCVAPPMPSLLDVKDFIREHASSGSHAADAKRSLNSTDLYERQTQVLIDEAVRLWVELVRPGDADSSTQPQVVTIKAYQCVTKFD